MPYIKINTPIPGPKSEAILQRRAKATPTGLAKSTNVVIDRASGVQVIDVDGNHLLDFAGGIGMLNAGHRPPAMVNAITEQMEKYIHVCALVASYEPYVALAEKLNEITPGDFEKKTILSNSGAESVENAIKIARAYTGRSGVITFEGAYHGRTLLTMSLTSKYNLFKKGFGPFAPEIYRLPVPNLYRKPVEMSDDSYTQWCIENLENALVTHISPEALAAIIIEPIQGEAGFIPIPKKFLKRIREICTEYGIVMIIDEIQSGFGRTGKLFAIEHYGIDPDIITMAKSMGGGMPIAATTGRSAIMDAPHLGGVGGTYGGSPLACVAALEIIKQINNEEFLQRAVAVGEIIHSYLQKWKSSYEQIGDVRGIGGMQLLEFVADAKTKQPDPDITLKIIRTAVENGLILIRAGVFSNCIRLLPPLVISDDELHEGMGVLEKSIQMHLG